MVPDSRSDLYRIHQVPSKHKAYPYQFRTGSRWIRSRLNAAINVANSFKNKIKKMDLLQQDITQQGKPKKLLYYSFGVVLSYFVCTIPQIILMLINKVPPENCIALSVTSGIIIALSALNTLVDSVIFFLTNFKTKKWFSCLKRINQQVRLGRTSTLLYYEL